MPQPDPEAADRWRESVRARALAHARAREPRGPRQLRVAAVCAAILLHLFAAVALYLLMRPRLMIDEGRIAVRLLDAAPSEPPMPEPAPVRPGADAVRVANARHAEIQAPPALPAHVDAAAAAETSLHLFNADGSVALPREEATWAVTAGRQTGFVSPIIAPSPLLQTRRPVKLRPNHFAAAWRVPENENLLGAALRKTAEVVDEKLTARKEFKTPWGSKVKCQASFMLVILAGCGWGFAPKPYEPEEHWKPATVLDEK